MHAGSRVLLLALGAVLTIACGGSAASTAAQQEEWKALQQLRGEIAAQREELGRWRRELLAEDAAAVATEDDEGLAGGELAARIASREGELARRSDELGRRLVALIAALGPAGERAPPERAAALRLKSDEDIEVAQEWIERGGDYRRAIEILELQRRHDAGYERLERALADARASRQVSAERFAQVSKGMSAAQVRAVLGPVNLRMVHRYPDRGVEAWLYPRQGGGVAGVFFRHHSERDAPVVYATSYELSSAHDGATPGPSPAEAPLG